MDLRSDVARSSQVTDTPSSVTPVVRVGPPIVAVYVVSGGTCGRVADKRHTV